MCVVALGQQGDIFWIAGMTLLAFLFGIGATTMYSSPKNRREEWRSIEIGFLATSSIIVLNLLFFRVSAHLSHLNNVSSFIWRVMRWEFIGAMLMYATGMLLMLVEALTNIRNNINK
jgi:Ca2+/Na+ antiporter